MIGNSGTSDRKERHLEVCVDPSRFRVETRPGGAGFDRLGFAHRALPELSLDEIDTGVEFLGQRLALPFLVSCMTGGSAGGGRVNRELARVANSAKVAFGLGSFRVLLRDETYLEDFRVKSLLPDVPLLANIGAVVLREAGSAAVLGLAERIEADALVVHLNPGQELFQADGDRDFRGLRAALASLFERSKIPVIVKETGFGIGPAEVRSLLAAGAAWVDLAGAGGTNWIAVESYRLEEGPLHAAAADFDDWGYPTALLLAALARAELPGRAAAVQPLAMGLPVIASGGLRNGVDVAKALALGAGLTAMALPLVRAVESGGPEAASAFIERVGAGLRSAMLLTSSHNLSELRRGILRFGPGFLEEARELAAADGRAYSAERG